MYTGYIANKIFLKLIMILVTKPLDQSYELKALFIKEKLDFVLFPAFEIKKITTNNITKSYDIVIFISVNAVIYASDYLQLIKENANKIFAVGPATAAMLAKYNIIVDIYPKDEPSSKKLLELVKYKLIKDKKILIVRGRGGLETLKDKLKKDNEVDYLEVYDRTMLDVTSLHKESIRKFFACKKGIILANSNQTLLNTMAIVAKINVDYIEDFK